jgi:membrane protease YdiL (CAAX protease family)
VGSVLAPAASGAARGGIVTARLAVACYLALAGVRVAGAFSVPVMVLSMAAMPAVLLLAPRADWSCPGALRDRPWWTAGAGVGVVLACYAAAVAASFAAFGSTDDNWLTGIPRLFAQLVPGPTALRVAAMLVCLGVVVPLVEEVCYRGVFFAAAGRRFGAAGAVLVTSALWAAVHLGDYGLNPYHPAVVASSQVSVFVMGLGLGVCRVATGSVSACVVAQGTANLALVGFLLVA